MTKRIFIANLVKRYNIYTNLQLNKVVNQFNRSQKNLHLDLAHYEVDRFFQQFKHNQLQLGYVTHPGHTKYYDHAEDALRCAELANLASLQRRHAPNDHDTEQSEIEYFTPQRIDLLLTRFGPLFNHNGISVCRAAQEVGISVTNSAQGITNCRDKWQAYRMVRDLVPVVNSSFATWETLKNLPKNSLNYPRITKPHAYSLGGQNVHLAHNQLQLVQQAYHLNEFDYTLNQDFIATNPNSSYDLRILCINGQVAGSYIRISAQESIVANISQGGMGIPYPIDPILKRQALDIVERLELDICGLDFIYNSKTSQWQFLEANACPGYQGFDEVLGRNFAEEIINYCVIRTTGHTLDYFKSTELSEQQLAELRPVNRCQAQVLQQQWNKEQQFQKLGPALELAIAHLIQAEPKTFAQLLEAKLACDCQDNTHSPSPKLRELETNEITHVTQVLHCISDLCVYFQNQLGGCTSLLERLERQIARQMQEELAQVLAPQQVMLGSPSITKDPAYIPTATAELTQPIARQDYTPLSVHSETQVCSPALTSPTSATLGASSPTILAGAIGISKIGLLPTVTQATLAPTTNSEPLESREAESEANSATREQAQDYRTELDCPAPSQHEPIAPASLPNEVDSNKNSSEDGACNEIAAEIVENCVPEQLSNTRWSACETSATDLDCTQLQELYRAWQEYCWTPNHSAPCHPSNGFPMLANRSSLVQQAQDQLRSTPKKTAKTK